MSRIPTYNQSKGRSVSSISGKSSRSLTLGSGQIFVNGRLENMPEKKEPKKNKDKSKVIATNLIEKVPRVLSDWSIDIYHIHSNDHINKIIVFYDMDPDAYIALMCHTGLAKQGKRKVLVIPKKGNSKPNDNLVKIANLDLVIKESNAFQRGKTRDEYLQYIACANKLKKKFNDNNNELCYAPVERGENYIELRIISELKKYIDSLQP